MNGKVSTITDPSNRVTAMVYDDRGNLIRITDPTGAARNFDYDAAHHMTEEINQAGDREQSFYDPVSGRAIRSIRADGSEIRLVAQDTVGLFDANLTKNIQTAPLLARTEAQATYVDSNGNITYSKLDGAGQTTSQSDAIGETGTTERNANNQVISQTDALGNTTRYTYDDRGNVIRQVEESSTTISIDSSGTISTTFGSGFGNPSDISVEMDDVNNDGLSDAVVLSKSFSTAGNNLSVWFGSANGQFIAGNTYALNSINTNFKLKDLNNDGQVDMLVGDNQEAIVYLGDGKGGFQQSNAYNLKSGKVETLSLDDIDGDRFDDLVYRDSGTFYVRLGRGTGEFGAAIETPVDWQDFTGGGYGEARVAFAAAATPTTLGEISTGDLDGDGKTDWLVPTSQGFRAVYNKGLCDYRAQTEVFTGILATSAGAALADFDRDGDLDVWSWASGGFSANLYINSGTGNFTFSRTIVVGTGIDSIITTDFDGNNTTDLVIRSASGDVSIVLGNGNGTFQPEQALTGLPTSIKSIAVGDFDGYGLNDLLTFTTTGISLVPGWSLPVGQSTRPGNVSSYTYDPIWNKLTSSIDALGRKTLYEINAANGNQLSMTRVVGLEDSVSGETDDVTTRYTYSTFGLLDTQTDALGRVTDYDYDSRGNLVRSTQAKGTPDEAVTTYEYDLAGNQTAMIDALGRRTEYQYDAANQLIRMIQPDPDGAGLQVAPVTEYQYDRMGHQVLMRDPRGNVTRYEYDQMGRMTKTIGADPDGVGAQVSGVTTYEYDLAGNQVAVVDPLGRRTTSIYDVRDRLVTTVDANGGRRQTIYDADDRVIGRIDANGNRTSMIYDAEGRVIREVNALSQVQSTEYNSIGQVVSTTDQLGRRTRYQYDDLDRQVAVIDTLGNTTRTEYDKLGNVISTVDGIGNATTYNYDALNRQVKVTDAKGGITNTLYDAVGNVARIKDSVGNSTTYTYDAINRLLTETNQLNFTRSHAYDAVGNKIEMIDRTGRKTTYGYDSLNRRTAENWLNSAGQSLRAIGYTYDAVGNAISVTDPDAKYTYSYDALNRLVTVNNAGTIGVPAVVFNYSYDAVGRLILVGDKINGTNAAQTSYAYDQLNRVTQIAQTGSGVQNKRVDMTYNQVNQITGLTRFIGRGLRRSKG